MSKSSLRIRILILSFLLLVGWSGPAHATVQSIGAFDSVAIETNSPNGNLSFLISLEPEGVVEVSPYAPDVVRVRFHWDSLWDKEEVAIAKSIGDWPTHAVQYAESATNFVVETDQLIIEVVKDPFRVHFHSPAGHTLLRSQTMEYDVTYHPIDDPTYDVSNWMTDLSQGFKLKATMKMPSEEAYFGLGQYPGPLNRRGHTIQGWNQDTFAWTEFQNPMYMTLPFFYGVRGSEGSRPATAYGVFFNNPTRPTFRMGTEASDRYSFEAGDGQLDYFFFGGGDAHEMSAVLMRYTELTGYPAMLPKWAFGYHQSKHSYHTQNRIHELVDDFVQYDIPCDVIYLDIGSQNNNYQMTFNSNFTNIPHMIEYALDRGIRLVPLIEPLLKTDDPLWNEANSGNYFLKNHHDQSTYVGNNFLGNISWIDYSYTPARTWWLEQITNYLASYPFPGIWNDLNEPNENNMPLNVLFELDGRYGGSAASGDTRNWLQVNRNTFNVMECSLTYEAMQVAFPDQRPFVLSRSAWPGIQRYALGWSGDNVSSYDHLRHNTPLGVSVMISGQVNFGHDIGGFVDQPSDELMVRWMQAGALMPYYRNHTFATPFDAVNREPFEFDPLPQNRMRDVLKFRYQLMPYLYTLAYKSHVTGIPMNTPTTFHFMSDTNTFGGNDYDFMVGDYLLAAPVYEEGADARWVYLPDGADWYYMAYDEWMAGGQWVNVPATEPMLPLFARAGAIIPMGPAMQYVDEFVPDFLDVHVWPSGETEFTLYEDDGLSTNYLAGDYAMTRFRSDDSAGAWSFTVEERTGTFDPGARDFYVIAHAVAPAETVYMDGQLLPRRGPADLREGSLTGWSYDYVSRLLTVRIPDSGQEQVITVTFDSPPALPGPFTANYEFMSIPGTHNNWNQAARNMTLIDDYTWAAVLDLTGHTSIEFKFAADNTWTTNWGDDSPAGTSLPLAGSGDSFGANIALTGLSDGYYTFTFNELTLAYTVEPAELSDLDGNGLPDAWEVIRGFSPYDPANASWVLDGSGQSVRDQYIAGTDPFDPESLFVFEGGVGPEGTDYNLSWQAVSGRLYGIWINTNVLTNVVWQPVPGLSNLWGSGWVTVADTNEVDAAIRYYRLETQLE